MADTLRTLGERFESICERILAADGFRVSRQGEPGAPDMLIEDQSGERIAVEVKLYRSFQVDRSILRNAAAQVVRYKQRNQTKGMLIATALLEPRDVKLLKNIGVDEVWDLSTIAKKASVDAALSADLQQLFRDAEIEYATLLLDFQYASGDMPEAPSAPAKTRSEELIEAFKGTAPGPADSRTFEKLCSDSIKHLFGEHLGQL